jgi:hypothetical protein
MQRLFKLFVSSYACFLLGCLCFSFESHAQFSRKLKQQLYQRYTYISQPRSYNGLDEVYPDTTIFLVRDYQLRYGYINRQGEEVIPCVYDLAKPFGRGINYVFAKKDGIAYDIDRKGRQKPYKHSIYNAGREELSFFCKPCVGEKRKKGVKDTAGNQIIPPIYTTVYYIRSVDLFEVSKTKVSKRFANKEIQAAAVEEYEEDVENETTRYGLISMNGKIILPCIYEKINTEYKFNYVIIKQNGLYGLANKQGKMLIKPQYQELEFFRAEKANTFFAAKKVEGEYFGIINAKNAIIQPFIYKDVSAYNSFVSTHNTQNVVGKNWQLMFPDRYKEIEVVYDDYDEDDYDRDYIVKNKIYRATTANLEVDYYNKEGKLIVDRQVMEIKDVYRGRITVKYNGLCGLLNPDSTWAVFPQYENIESCRLGYVVSVYKKEQNQSFKGLLDHNLQEVLPMVYENISYIKAKNENVFLNLESNVHTPLVYQQFKTIEIQMNWWTVKKDSGYSLFLPKEPAKNFATYDDLKGHHFAKCLVFSKNSMMGILDKNGKEVFDFMARSYEELEFVDEDLFSFQKDNLWGLVTTNGKEISKAVYEKIFRFREGVAIVKKNNKYGYLTEYGQLIAPCTFDKMKSFIMGLGKAQRGKKVYHINRKGQNFQIPVPKQKGDGEYDRSYRDYWETDQR